MKNTPAFQLSANSYGHFICESPVSEEAQQDYHKAMVIFIFNQIIYYINTTQPCVTIQNITCRVDDAKSKVALCYFIKDEKMIGALSYVEFEYPSLEELYASIGQDFSNLL